jgi:tetratricopeptide (TPR) repeat protein
LARQFPSRFDNDPALLYLLARTQAAQGNQRQAEQLAEQALKLNPGRDRERLRDRILVAGELHDNGQFSWARREFEQVIRAGQSEVDLRVLARLRLSEMLYDQGDCLAAANLRKELDETLGKNKPDNTLIARRYLLGEIRSRMQFFFACHYQSQNDLKKQREHLARAIQTQPVDIDALIACYHLPDEPPEFRSKVRADIKRMAMDCEEQLGRNPTQPHFYNLYAWLVGNTEGDLDKALRYAKKAIELAPEESRGGLYDTLAHVYFTRGDYEDAVKSQLEAVKREPYSGVITRKLKLFQQALREQQAKDRSSTDDEEEPPAQSPPAAEPK